jgi:hypothetical protein
LSLLELEESLEVEVTSKEPASKDGLLQFSSNFYSHRPYAKFLKGLLAIDFSPVDSPTASDTCKNLQDSLQRLTYKGFQ